ncbi:tetratricopeptide repeat protein [Actinosynnema sp. NPDC023794]
MTAFAATVVICRPDQLREAAVVLSCVPAGGFVPVIVVEPPPMSEAEYVRGHLLAREQRDRTQQMIGGPLGKAEVLAATRSDPEQRRRMLAEFDLSDRLDQAIAPYQSWLKHNEMVAGLVAVADFARAVFLFEPRPEDLYTSDPAYVAEASRAWDQYHHEVFGEVPPDEPYQPPTIFGRQRGRVTLIPGRDLTDLPRAAWSLLRPDERMPQAVEVDAEGGSAVYLAGLSAALRAGLPLRPMSGAPAVDPNDDTDSEEAVLVEDTGNALSLLGVLYAHHRSARLVITPMPVLDDVQHAVAAHQELILEEAKGLFDAIRDRMAAGRRDRFAAIETAVTSQVPAEVITAVGDRRLTAFTTGLPYSFVRTADADWSGKPIGHVAADPTLVVLTEVGSSDVTDRKAAFSLVFDPGYFRTSETEDVMRQVGGHFTHSILLDGPHADGLALMHLPRKLPVELVFFNTHGSDDGIVLGNIAIPNRFITRHVKFPHRPIIFNNSCQSWTGVGREFVRVGARGYIGTLWSVPADLAADFARIVTTRLTASEATACQAIVGTGLPDTIERSYIYAGTANGRLTSQPRRTDVAAAALAACDLLLTAAADVPPEQTRLVRRETADLRKLVDGTDHEETAEYVDVLLGELSLVIRYEALTDADAADAHSLVARIDSLTERVTQSEQEKRIRLARRHAHTGHLHERRAELTAALDHFQRAVALAPDGALNQQLRAAQLLAGQGELEEAMRIGTLVRTSYAERHDMEGLLQANGFLGQLARKLGRYDEALRYAEEGYRHATVLHSVEQQAKFKMDEYAIHAATGDHALALAATQTSLALMRQTRDAEGELAAYGNLGSCYLALGDAETARSHAEAGLRQARRLGLRDEEATFLMNLGTIVTVLGDLQAGLEHQKAATTLLAEQGAWARLTDALPQLARTAAEVGDADTLWSITARTTTMCGTVGELLRAKLVPVMVWSLRHAVEVGTLPTTERGLSASLQALQTAHPGNRDTASDHVQLIGDILVLTAHWVGGLNTTVCVANATELDRMTGGALDLVALFSVPYAPRPDAEEQPQRRPFWRRRG